MAGDRGYKICQDTVGFRVLRKGSVFRWQEGQKRTRKPGTERSRTWWPEQPLF